MITIVALAVVLCTSLVNSQTVLSNSGTGQNNGYYYAFWKDSGDATMTLEAGGRYTGRWSTSTNNWVGGKGWNPGSASRTINYSGTFNSSGNSYLSLYGWSRNPLVEYYVVESYGSYNPGSCGSSSGTYTSGGATYTAYKCRRTNQPSIDGTASFDQYISVRTPKQNPGSVSGTVSFSDHVQHWATLGWNLGTMDEQIIASEGYQSSGTTDITVS